MASIKNASMKHVTLSKDYSASLRLLPRLTDKRPNDFGEWAPEPCGGRTSQSIGVRAKFDFAVAAGAIGHDFLPIASRYLGRRALALPADVAEADEGRSRCDAVTMPNWGKIDIWVNVAISAVFASLSDLTVTRRVSAALRSRACFNGTEGPFHLGTRICPLAITLEVFGLPCDFQAVGETSRQSM